MYSSSEAALEDPTRNLTFDDAESRQEREPSKDDDDPTKDGFWLSRARSSYEASQDWFDVAVRRKMEDNLRLFNSTHIRGSRYDIDTAENLKRSSLFRPKTRSGVRKLEAACAAAFFATEDALNCSPPNPADRMQKLAAETLAELLNYRLKTQIKWFVTCVGGLQDAAKQGVVISKQEWNYREVTDVYEEDEYDAMTGEAYNTRRTYETRVVNDHPQIKLRPVENIRFSPAADWTDPLQSSPYLIDMEPMFVGDIMERMRTGPKGEYEVAFRSLPIETIRSALKQNYDPIRQAREGYREDRYEETRQAVQEHDAVWVHHNYFRIYGQDWYYCTLGTEIMLSDPVPLEEVTPLRERPYVLGNCVLETHKPYPAGIVELLKPLQEEINDLTNLRMDNIRHVISPRYFVKRGVALDIRSLLRNVAGGVTAMEDPERDIKIRQISDATGSSFEEQDRLSVEADELAGTTSQSSIAANHNINERVGNAMLLTENANQITELTIRLFAETWVEPVLQQIMELEQKLESDEVVMALVGQRMGIPAQQVFRMLDLPVKVTCNVGFGATNPQLRLQKVGMAFKTLAEINPMWVQGADQMEVTTEVLGAVGYKSAERFFPTLSDSAQQDPKIAQLQQENDMLKQQLQSDGAKTQGMLQGKQMEVQGKVQIEQLRLQSKERSEQQQNALKYKIEQNKFHLQMLEYELDQEQNSFKRQELVMQMRALNHTIAMDERQYELQRREMALTLGSPGQEPTPPKMNTEATPAKVSMDNPAGGKRRIASSPKIGSGDDMAGVIARGDYGAVPGAEG